MEAASGFAAVPDLTNVRSVDAAGYQCPKQGAPEVHHLSAGASVPPGLLAAVPTRLPGGAMARPPPARRPPAPGAAKFRLSCLPSAPSFPSSRRPRGGA